MTDDSQEKQHLPTPKKLLELRKKGMVLRSRDLSAGVVLVVACLMLLFCVNSFYQQIIHNFTTAFTIFSQYQDYSAYFSIFFKNIMLASFLLILPVLLICFLSGFLSAFLFGGWNFSLSALQFNLEKLDPIKNLTRIFSLTRIAMEIVKSFIKFILLFITLGVFIYYKKTFLMSLMNDNALTAASLSYQICMEFMAFMLLAVCIIVVLDAIYQKYEFMKQAKMSTQEIKDETKDTEGNADIKRKLRSTQFALFKQRLSLSVPKSTVIITNPTHYAIALRYADGRDHAPLVLAKGVDEMAQQIRYYAIANAVPIYEAPLLARAIFHTSKIGTTIQPELYMAVAMVLSYVNQLKSYQMGVGVQPKMISDLEIPKEYIYDQ